MELERIKARHEDTKGTESLTKVIVDSGFQFIVVEDVPRVHSDRLWLYALNERVWSSDRPGDHLLSHFLYFSDDRGILAWGCHPVTTSLFTHAHAHALTPNQTNEKYPSRLSDFWFLPVCLPVCLLTSSSPHRPHPVSYMAHGWCPGFLVCFAGSLQAVRLSQGRFWNEFRNSL